MKIIRPVDLTKPGVLQSDAPIDALATWTPAGRDLLDYIARPIFDVAGDTLVAVSEDGGEIYKQSLSTGVSELVGHSVAGPVHSISVSPNEGFIHVVSNDSKLFKADFVDISTGAVKYSESQGFWVKRADKKGLKNNADCALWRSDSTASTFAVEAHLKTVDTSTWVATTVISITDIPLQALSAAGSETWKDVYGGAFVSVIALPSGEMLASGRIYGEQDTGLPGSWPINRGFTMKLSPAGAVVVVSLYPNETALIPWLRWNDARAELLAFRDSEARKLDISTLNDIGAPSVQLDSGLFTERPSALKISGPHLITRSLSTSPFWNYRLLTDYSLAKSLPALAEPGEGIAVGSDYTAVQQSHGVALLSNVDDSIVEQQNPNVTAGDVYIYGDTIYKALSNNNDRPDLGATGDPSATWLDMGKINPLRMTDGKVGSFTEAPSPLVIEITSGDLIDGIAMFGLSAATVRAELIEAGVTVFDSGEKSLRDSSMINGWYNHFFARRGVKRDFVLTSLPPYRGATVRITLTATDGPVRIGELVAGQVRKLGDLLFGSRFGIEDWSRKERNVFGHWEVVERGYSKRGDYQVSIRTNQVSWIQQLLAGLRATPVVYIGSESQQLSIIYGFFVVLDLVVEKPVYSQCRIEVEGLTDDSATN